MSECVLCLGNRRKQTFKVEILISELQSKLWKRDLRALNRGPHPVRKSGIPPENPLHTHLADPDRRCVWMGAVFLTLERTPWQRVLGVAQLRKVPSLFVPTNTTVRSLCVRCPWTSLCTAISRHISPPSLLCYLSLEHFFFLPQR